MSTDYLRQNLGDQRYAGMFIRKTFSDREGKPFPDGNSQWEVWDGKRFIGYASDEGPAQRMFLQYKAGKL